MDGWIDRLDSQVPKFFHTYRFTVLTKDGHMHTDVCLLLCLANQSCVFVGTGDWGRRYHIISLGNLSVGTGRGRQLFLHISTLSSVCPRVWIILEVLPRQNSYTYRGTAIPNAHPPPSPYPFSGNHHLRWDDGALLNLSWAPGWRRGWDPWPRKSIASLWSGTFLGSVGLCFPKDP